MKTWADFYDDYLSDLPGLTLFAAANQLRLAAQEFCQKTKCLVQTQDPVITTATDTVYDFNLPRNVSLVQLISATVDGQTVHNLNTDNPGMMRNCIRAVNTKQFELIPAQAAGIPVITTCSVKPSKVATGVDDWLWEQYAEQISLGARARLMTLKDKPYTDAQLGIVNGTRFEEAIGQAKIDAARAHSKAPIRVKASFM